MGRSVEFSPNNISFKNPIGGVEVNEETYFLIRFSRPSNPAEVFVCITKDGEHEVRYQMNYVSTSADGIMDYETKLSITSKGLYFYHFLVQTESEDYRIGCDESLNAMLGRGQEWQLTVFENIYNEPKWLNGGVIYQIMVDRFNIGNERLKTKPYINYRDDWGETPNYEPTKDGKILNNDMFGGNLAGVTKKLGYLKSLGITCIYLNPIFEARSNHKYDTGNYQKIDPDFGTVKDFEELIKKAEKKNMKIILDGVFSHTGDDSLYFNKYGNYDSVGAYQSKDSPYYSWYNFADFESRKYKAWWDIDILPNTNEEDKYFDEYINGQNGIIRYWTEKGIGGWRLDVVDELPDKFLDRMVRSAKSANPDALVLGEVWEDASNKISYSQRRRYLQGGQLDSVMNYPFKEDIFHFIKTRDSSKLYNTVNVIRNNYPKKVLNNLMNLLDTHDTPRVLTLLGDNGDIKTRAQRANAKVLDLDNAIEKLKMATVLQFTLMGVPCIYYGDEVALEGFEDPFNRRCIDWKKKNNKVLKIYKRLGALRAEERNIFADGDYNPLKFSSDIFAFERIKNNEKIIVIVNNGVESFNYEMGEDAYTNLIDLKPFKGEVKASTAVILKKTKDVARLNELSK